MRLGDGWEDYHWGGKALSWTHLSWRYGQEEPRPWVTGHCPFTVSVSAGTTMPDASRNRNILKSNIILLNMTKILSRQVTMFRERWVIAEGDYEMRSEMDFSPDYQMELAWHINHPPTYKRNKNGNVAKNKKNSYCMLQLRVQSIFFFERLPESTLWWRISETKKSWKLYFGDLRLKIQYMLVPPGGSADNKRWFRRHNRTYHCCRKTNWTMRWNPTL